MAALKDEVKAFIVQALACFDTPSQVCQAVKDQYGIEVSRQLCERYDPTKYSGRDLGQKWKTFFEECRKRFREETIDIPIANRAYRLRALGRMAENMKNIEIWYGAPTFKQAKRWAAEPVVGVFDVGGIHGSALLCTVLIYSNRGVPGGRG